MFFLGGIKIIQGTKSIVRNSIKLSSTPQFIDEKNKQIKTNNKTNNVTLEGKIK